MPAERSLLTTSSASDRPQRRLVMHMGIGKTGSTALQIAFVRNRAQLADRGVHYPKHASDAGAHKGAVISGNGTRLVMHLAPREGLEDEEGQALPSVVDEVLASRHETVLYSSELLYQFQPEKLEELRDSLAAVNVGLEGVVYVRDVAGHALSSYSQAVKRRLYTPDFATYVDGEAPGSYRLSLRVRLGRLRRILGSSRVHVLHYDSARSDLFGDFMRSVFDVHDLSGFDLADEEFNRSLTPREVQMMRYMNRSLASRDAARRVSDVLISRPPLGPRSWTISRAHLQRLADRFSEDVAWVNEAFFSDSRLQVAGRDTRVVDAASTEMELTDGERQLLDCLVVIANNAGARRARRNPRRR